VTSAALTVSQYRSLACKQDRTPSLVQVGNRGHSSVATTNFVSVDASFDRFVPSTF